MIDVSTDMWLQEESSSVINVGSCRYTLISVGKHLSLSPLMKTNDGFVIDFSVRENNEEPCGS